MITAFVVVCITSGWCSTEKPAPAMPVFDTQPQCEQRLTDTLGLDHMKAVRGTVEFRFRCVSGA